VTYCARSACYVPTIPENRTFKVSAFYRWLNLFSKVLSINEVLNNSQVLSDDKWFLYPGNIKPGKLPFAIDIDSIAREPLARDSIDHISPGAYILLTDGLTRSFHLCLPTDNQVFRGEIWTRGCQGHCCRSGGAE
jgi:hypothetical protein